ncbi:hypothetical protein LUW10_32075 (plasmid) [Pseudomonas veronii]|uniref:Uncharacterized protein n=4 Tax=Pseudomonas TaxID=286 RepID=F1LIQ7_PSEPU|nr:MULTISPECIES: hypothetical protein [Pseudomonadaceae]HEJ3361539.1 hypothetical protein [Pseudomonas aeruginosa]ASI38132.1 Hypothetical protein [Pseudomonas fluorescens]KEX90259.1 hypothetical protein HA62_32855 [Pseudomonas putida]MBJ2221376.1 hypothetical protein [Pseudomonas sp. MF7453]MCT9823954.1 hypothetical protein [Pseudomonas veronii]
MSNDKNVKTERPRMLVVDEYSNFFGGLNDTLKEELRNVSGVPNATYLVNDGKVFVFDKLVHLVKERQKEQPHAQLQEMARSLTVEELALSLIAEATVSAKEAVEAWGVVPVPYQTETLAAMDTATLESRATGRLILHRPFNARLPGDFQEEGDVKAAFANLLVGGVLPGSGDFTYRGQPMTLRDPLDLALLPARPEIPEGPAAEGWVYTALGNVEFEAGFEPVSEVMFNAVKEAEAKWRGDIAHAAKHAQERAAEVWAQAAGLRLETLNDPTEEVPEYGEEEFPQLRALYPELSMLSDGTLYSLFDVFQMECHFINGWAANRDDDFLFYLLGKVADRKNDHDTAKEVGEWVADALLHGATLDAALEIGRSADRYNQAIGKLAHRIADAMRFLAEDKKATDLRGRTITTMGDTFRIGRKYNATAMVVEQKLPF